MKREIALTTVIVLSLSVVAPRPTIAAESVPDLLRRQTQELFDAITAGSPDVWERYVDADLRLVDENGSILTRREIIAAAKPLPPGVSGTIRVVDFQATIHGNVAVTTHLDDESENYHGHQLHCQYRVTDTWVENASVWRLLASQVMAVRMDPPSVELADAVREQYCGRYELAPGITYEIRLSGGRLEGQQTGRKAEPLLAEVTDVLFVPGSPRYRKIFARGTDGKISGFAERREAWDLNWKRMP